MKGRILLAVASAVLAAGLGGYLLYQDALVPVPLASDQALFEPADPEFGEDEVVLEALMPASDKLQAFLLAQSDLSLLEPGPDGGWTGQLLSGPQGSRHGRRWRLSLGPGWRSQDGRSLDASRSGQALAGGLARVGGQARVIDERTLELRFKNSQKGLPALLSQWRVPGSGPFRREGATLARFDDFVRGRAGVAGLRVVTDTALLEGRAWAEGLAAGRWAWAAFPGGVAPEDMARVRLAPYDEVRLKDGSVWFLSSRLRRFRPWPGDWTRTRLFGIWKGAMDLPYEPEP
jgi:hypothetical protein